MVAACAATSALVLSEPTAAHADTTAGPSPSVAYTGLAYGTQVSALDSTVRLGKTPVSSVSCTSKAGTYTTKSLAGVTLPLVGNVGAVTTLVRTTETSTHKRTNAQSRVAGVNLLGGQIKADAINANASAYAKAGSVNTGVNTLTLTNLTIAGRPISANVAKNTKVTIPGVAEVTVNKQTQGLSKTGYYSAVTTGLSVELLEDNPLGLPTSTKINIAGATATVATTPGDSTYAGRGFSTRVRALGGAVTSAETASAGVPCLGGTNRNELAGVNVPLLVNTGTTETTARGLTDSTRDWTRVTNRTASPSLLGGLITADAIVAETTVGKWKDSGRTTYNDTSKFVGLKIAGKPVADVDLAPNSTIEIPGVAKVVVHQQIKGQGSMSVTMLRVELLQGVAGLPVGSIIEVGYSRSDLN
ncbi:choice-of-anchor P family protein [Janibacter sp. G349]